MFCFQLKLNYFSHFNPNSWNLSKLKPGLVTFEESNQEIPKQGNPNRQPSHLGTAPVSIFKKRPSVGAHATRPPRAPPLLRGGAGRSVWVFR